MVLYVPIIYSKGDDSMSIKSSMAFLALGIGGTLMYQQVRNGNFKRMVSKMNKAKVKAVDDLENMM